MLRAYLLSYYTTRVLALVGLVAALAFAVAACRQGEVRSDATSAASSVPASTPAGITTIDVVREAAGSPPEYLWTRLGDANGKTVLRFVAVDHKPLSCDKPCAQDFQAVLADPRATAFGDWTLLALVNGTKQWAYLGDALYVSTKEKTAGDIVKSTLCQEAVAVDPEAPCPKLDFELPQGWSPVHYTPGKSANLPPFVSVRRIPEVMGNVLVNERGHTLYVHDRSAKAGKEHCDDNAACALQWQPFAAAAMSHPVGHFTIGVRPDGTRQWAHEGRPLFTFAGDNEAGDINGYGVDRELGVAYLSRDFAPTRVAVQEVPGRGMILVTTAGNALYTRHAVDYRWGGRNLRHGFSNDYLRGKALGPSGCIESCLNDWKPFLAGADAVASGYWEPVQRPDGTRQWAYQGNVLYTYSHDPAPQVVTGSNLFEYVAGAEHSRYATLAAVTRPDDPPSGFATGGVGLYWHVAEP